MRKLHTLTIIVLIAAIVGVSTLPAATADAAPAQQGGGLLTNIPVTGSLSDGGTFEGLLTVTELAIQNGQLVVSGTLQGTATAVDGTVTAINQTFDDVVASLLGNGSSCSILFLDVGPIFLDLLGLQVDLSQITLDVTAVRGAGNLLGNLLCAVAGLLDRGGPLTIIQRLLDRINNLL